MALQPRSNIQPTQGAETSPKPTRRSQRPILYRYCAHPEGYKACMLKQALDHYYERKYETHE